MDEKIVEKYTTIKNPGSFSGISSFFKNNKKFKLKKIKKVCIHFPLTHYIHQQEISF